MKFGAVVVCIFAQGLICPIRDSKLYKCTLKMEIRRLTGELLSISAMAIKESEEPEGEGAGEGGGLIIANIRFNVASRKRQSINVPRALR